MAKDSSIRTFKCPTCGAPLEPEAGRSTMKCPYCSASVVIPKALRIAAAAPAPSPRVQPPAAETPHPSAATSGEDNRPARDGRKPAFNFGAIITAAVVVALGAVAYFTFGASAISSMLFARQVLSFGARGTGQGLFQDPRAIGADGGGNVVVADFEDGRVQVFGPDGKFITLFNISGQAQNHYIRGLAVSHDGKIYVDALTILIYDEKGQMLGQVGSSGTGFDDIALGADGTLYALSGDDIYRLKSDGSTDLQIPKSVSTIIGEPAGELHLAVDGLGDMYVVDAKSEAVFKYSPEGKFIDQFGEPVELNGSCNGCNTFQIGRFWSPNGIAIDGYGRIFVSDFDATQVFDSNGKYLNYLSGGFFGIALDGQGDLYATNINGHNVVKYQIQRP